MLLSELVDRLVEDIPGEDGTPSTEQYEQAVKDAVRDFSEQCGLEQIGTLNIVSGTAAYDLPADFLKMIMLESFASPDGILNTPQGLIPISANWNERHTIRNGRITFYPTPTYTMPRNIRYKAAWILTVPDEDYADEEYETLGEREARIVLLKAQAIALTKQANAQAGSSLKYSFGAVSEDLSTSSDTSKKSADSLESEYLKACKVYNGQHVTY
jgi:hypothetical protein